jgi:hypothetical protein
VAGCAEPGKRWSLRAGWAREKFRGGGESRCRVAGQIVLQFAARNIGQLTDKKAANGLLTRVHQP